MKAQIITGDCVEVMKGMAENSVDAIVCDPPYHLTTGKKSATGFMGKAWDGGGIAFDPAMWCEALRVLKPGGFLLAFGGSRTYHRMTCAIEDAGFEVRDEIVYFLSGDSKRDEFLLSLSERQREIFMEAFGRPSTLFWTFGSGFPKSCDVSKAIDKESGAEREIVGISSITGKRSISSFDDGCKGNRRSFQNDEQVVNHRTAPTTEAARQWEGFGSALKPSHEPIVLARKPLAKGLTIAANVLEYGTGGLNIGACRIETGDKLGGGRNGGSCKATNDGWNRPYMDDPAYVADMAEKSLARTANAEALGRWPANICISIPPDEYALRNDLTPCQRKEVFRWLHENA